MNKLIKGDYQSPALLEWTILNEGILCSSGNNEAYAGEESDNYMELF